MEVEAAADLLASLAAMCVVKSHASGFDPFALVGSTAPAFAMRAAAPALGCECIADPVPGFALKSFDLLGLDSGGKQR